MEQEPPETYKDDTRVWHRVPWFDVLGGLTVSEIFLRPHKVLTRKNWESVAMALEDKRAGEMLGG